MVTTWRVNGSSECPLIHSSSSVTSTCGAGIAFMATAGTGFGTSATSFSSTLSDTATPELDGTLIECFGPGTRGGDLGNRVGDSAIHVLGQQRSYTCYSIVCDHIQCTGKVLIMQGVLQTMQNCCVSHSNLLSFSHKT